MKPPVRKLHNMLPAGSRYCLCRECGRYFKSPSSFDAHRSGPYTARICLDPVELGMVQNRHEHWMAPWPAKDRAWLLRNGKLADFSEKPTRVQPEQIASSSRDIKEAV